MRSEVSETSTGRTATRRPTARSLRRSLAAVLTVAVGSMGIAACGGGSSSSHQAVNKTTFGTKVAGDLPTQGTPTQGGTITTGQLQGQTPLDIFPIIDGATCSTVTMSFVSSMYIPLYNGPSGAKPAVDYQLSAGEPPAWSNGDKTVALKIKPGLKWSDGKPVDAKDLLFDWDLLLAGLKESPANWCQYASPTAFPYDVSAVHLQGKDTLVMQLKKAVNPEYFLNNALQDTDGGLYPLPSSDWNIAKAGGPHLDFTKPANAKAIFNYLIKAGSSVATFQSNPLWKVVDGPFKLTSFSPTNSSFTQVPNPSYGLHPKPHIAKLETETFTSIDSQLNALKAGTLDIGGLDAATQYEEAPTLRKQGYAVFGTPGWSWYGAIINFDDTTNAFNKIMVQPYVKGVLAELINQPQIVKHVYHNWAIPQFGPVPSAPSSPYAPSDAKNPPYPYNPQKAAATLKAHGWSVKPGGITTCSRPGSGADECGAGIPKGDKFEFSLANVPQSTAATGVLESEAFASTASQYAGIKIDLTTKTFNFMIAHYNDNNPANKSYTNQWGMANYGGAGMDFYPTQFGIENPGGFLNDGNFNDPTANKLMNNSVNSVNPQAIKQEASYLTKNYPVIYWPNPDQIAVVSKKIGGPPASFLVLGYQQSFPQFWYIKKNGS